MTSFDDVRIDATGVVRDLRTITGKSSGLAWKLDCTFRPFGDNETNQKTYNFVAWEENADRYRGALQEGLRVRITRAVPKHRKTNRTDENGNPVFEMVFEIQQTSDISAMLEPATATTQVREEPVPVRQPAAPTLPTGTAMPRRAVPTAMPSRPTAAPVPPRATTPKPAPAKTAADDMTALGQSLRANLASEIGSGNGPAF